MEQGYEDTRFKNTVDRHFHCPICLNVLRDPVQCRRNQHYFCTPCITKHLQENSQTCPTCKERLTVETLGRSARILTDFLSTLKIGCDYTERGCREMVKLGALKTHIAGCGFGPVMCSNDKCLQVVDRRDKEVHETKVCRFRMVKCDYCGEEMQFRKINRHRCPTRKEIDEIKSELSEVKDKLNQLRSSQEEMAKAMTSMMNDIKERITANTSCKADNVTEQDIIIAGGSSTKSVEVFIWSYKVWVQLGRLTQLRSYATSFVYENHMFVTGGGEHGFIKTNSMEKMDLTQTTNVGKRIYLFSTVKLPFACYGHRTVLDQNRLIVIGGVVDLRSCSNTISEVSLTHPYSSKLLIHMPLPRCFHGAEHIGDKIYILGGKTENDKKPNIFTHNVQMYDLISNSCKQMAPLPFAVSTMATVGWKDNVILLGGENENGEVLNTVIKYNVNTEKSTMLPEMKERRKGCAAVITGNKIVVMGGMDETRMRCLSSVECYSFETNTWEDLPPMVQFRSNATAIVKPVYHI